MANHEVKVGAFALSGAAVLAGIITFMGALSFGPAGYKLHINYPQVDGLMKGHMVRYAGVQVGTVKDIKVATDKVEVVADIEKNIKIPKGAAFTISADGILGEKFVNIVPPRSYDSGYIEEGSHINGVSGGGMDSFFADSGELLRRLEKIAVAFENIFGDPEVQNSLKTGFKDFGEISVNMNKFTGIMAEVAVASQQYIVSMIRQMNELSRHMNSTVAHIDSVMTGVDNDGATGRNVAAIAQHMAQTSERMENIVKVLEQVAQDPVTSQSLKETLVNVRETSAKANKILGTFSEAEFALDAGRSFKAEDWRGSMGVKLKPGEKNYIYMGGYDIGGSNKVDFIAGRKFGRAGLEAGAMQGELGVGASYDFGNSLKIYSQAYNFDNLKVRLGGEVRLSDGISLYGESMDVRGNSKDTYFGVRSYF